MADIILREAPSGLGSETARRLLHTMLLIRRFEESGDKYYRAGKIGGYVHYCIGQEAVVAGLVPLLIEGDTMIASYRDHGNALALGSDPRSVMAELFGRSTGTSGGKGGSMHIFDVARGFLGGYGIVGGSVPLSVGEAFALKYRNQPNLHITFFGDGAMQQGAVHEAMNMAGLYRVPCLFVLENNGYAMGTSVARHSSQPDFVKRVSNAYNIPCESVDGMDVMAVRDAGMRVMDRIRDTGEPYFLEAITYRFVGHGYADNAQQQRFYRSEEEIARWRERDPIAMFTRHVLSNGLLSQADVDEMDSECRAVVLDAAEFADRSPMPAPDSLLENVLFNA